MKKINTLYTRIASVIDVLIFGFMFVSSCLAITRVTRTKIPWQTTLTNFILMAFFVIGFTLSVVSLIIKPTLEKNVPPLLRKTSIYRLKSPINKWNTSCYVLLVLNFVATGLFFATGVLSLSPLEIWMRLLYIIFTILSLMCAIFYLLDYKKNKKLDIKNHFQDKNVEDEDLIQKNIITKGGHEKFSSDKLLKELIEIKKMKDAGLINDNEYETLKSKIIANAEF